jgi:hypothetical protein
MSTLGHEQITLSTPPNPLPPLQPLANNIDGSSMELVELANSSGGWNVFVNSFVDEFVASLPTVNFGDSDGILDNAAPVNPTDGIPFLTRSLFNDGEEEMTLFAMGAVGGTGGQYCKFS